MSSPVGVPVAHDQYREVLEGQLTQLLADMDDVSSWNFHSEKNGVTAHTRLEDKITAAKGDGHLPFHPRAVWALLIDIENQKSYDTELVSSRRLVDLDAQTAIDYLEYKGMFFVSGRDFVTVVHWRVLPNETIVIFAHSIEDETLCPVKSKVVRGHVHSCGWRLVPDADYKGCHATYMVKTDLKGSIPARVAGIVAGDQPYLIAEVAQVLKKDKDIGRFETQGKLTNMGGAEE